MVVAAVAVMAAVVHVAVIIDAVVRRYAGAARVVRVLRLGAQGPEMSSVVRWGVVSRTVVSVVSVVSVVAVGAPAGASCPT